MSRVTPFGTLIQTLCQLEGIRPVRVDLCGLNESELTLSRYHDGLVLQSNRLPRSLTTFCVTANVRVRL